MTSLQPAGTEAGAISVVIMVQMPDHPVPHVCCAAFPSSTSCPTRVHSTGDGSAGFGCGLGIIYHYQHGSGVCCAAFVGIWPVVALVGLGRGVQYRHRPPRLCAAHGVEAALHRLTFGGLTGIALSTGQSPVAVTVEGNIRTPKQTFMMYCGVTMSVETLCVFFSALAVVHLSHPFPVCTTLKHQVRLV